MKYMFLIFAMVLPAMAGREFVAASSQDGRSTITAISTPLTMAAWVWPRQNTAAQVQFSLNSADNASERAQLTIDGTAAGDPLALGVITDGGTSATLTGTSSTATNAYKHVAGVFESTARRILYVSGVAEGTNTLSRALSNISIPSIGSRKNAGTYGAFWTGGIAEAAIWSAALTADEIASLASGAAPFMIRPASLVFHAPLTGRETATEIDQVGAAITLNNSPAIGTDHPRIYRP
jgi:hypothetical protein